MNNLRATEIMSSIAQGINPSKRDALLLSEVAKDEEIQKAFALAITALMRKSFRAKASGSSNRHGESWTDDERDKLKIAFFAKEPFAGIAARHQRSIGAIKSALEKLGLLPRPTSKL